MRSQGLDWEELFIEANSYASEFDSLSARASEMMDAGVFREKDCDFLDNITRGEEYLLSSKQYKWANNLRAKAKKFDTGEWRPPSRETTAEPISEAPPTPLSGNQQVMPSTLAKLLARKSRTLGI